mgnify:CR=1 FL=1
MSYWKVLLEKWKAFICNKRRKRKNGLFYIGGSDTLPPPLSAEEEQQAGGAFMGGSKKARDLLIEHNLRLVVYIARKFESAGINVEDLISIGTIGLIKAVNTFKIEKNIKLATYASRCIENEILMYLRRTSKTKGEVSLDEPLNVDWDGNELMLSDILGTETDEVYGHLMCDGKALRQRAGDRGDALRTCGQQGDDAKGSSGAYGNFAVVYFQAGKEDHRQAAE